MARPPVRDLASVAHAGDLLETLRELRDVIARAMSASEVPARDLAALSRQLTQVLAEIDALKPPVQEAGTPLDEVNARRVARGAAPARAAGSKAGR